MKKLSLAEWENKYIVGSVDRFDQKYTMFKRPDWDSEIREQLDDWSFEGKPKDKPGHTIEDFGLRRATRRIMQVLELINMSKPNPTAASKALMTATANSSLARIVASNSSGQTKIDVSDRQKITHKIKKVATYFGADLVGICRLDRRWVYSHTYDGGRGDISEDSGISVPQEIPEEFQYAVVMGFGMDYDLLKYFSSAIAGAASNMGYSRMAITNSYVSEYIRSLGFKAIDCTRNDVALSVPMAMQAGLGDLGRNGFLISPQFGPRLRLSKVITDLPLISDSPMDFGVTEFCIKCKKCADMCPSHSISHGGQTNEVNNVSNAANELKWRINAETCRMYWSRAQRGGGCTICISCCPYNKASTWPHRIVHWFTDHVRWADSLYVKMDDLLGYGKPRKADNFWEEWRPKSNHK